MEYNVVTLYNRYNGFSVKVFQIKKSEFKIKTQIGHNSYSYDYVDNMYDLSRLCFCYLINGYELLSNHLQYEFAYAIHSGIFSEYEEHKPQEKKIEEKKFEGIPLRRCSSFITAYQENDEHEPDEEQTP